MPSYPSPPETLINQNQLENRIDRDVQLEIAKLTVAVNTYESLVEDLEHSLVAVLREPFDDNPSDEDVKTATGAIGRKSF